MKYSRTTTALAAMAALGSVAFVGLAGAQDSRASAGVELPNEVVAAASAFSAYMDRAAGLNGHFDDGEGVAQALKAGVSYEPEQFQEGMVGYGALAALQEGRFVSGVDAAAAQAGDRQALAERIAQDPATVLSFAGADAAVARVRAALAARGASVQGAGGEVKQSAYAIQHQPWSLQTVPDSAGRLAQVKALSSSPFNAGEGDDARLLQTVLALKAPAEQDGGVATKVVVRALALAAEAELGAAGNAALPSLRPLLAESSTTDCLRIAKLNLYQCMAVAGPQYEDVFCLGQHALMDTGKCVAQAAGQSAPPTALAMNSPAHAPTPAPAAERAFMVPVVHTTLVSNAN